MIKCKHFGICGGCSLQNLEYEEQINKKKEILKNLFNFDFEFVKSNKEYNYRNRMDFIYNEGLCLRERGKFDSFVKIERCELINEKCNEILKILNQRNIEKYDLKTKQGFLRYVVIRKTNKEYMVNLVVNEYNEKRKKQILNFIKNIDVNSVNILLNNTLTDVSLGEVVESFNKNFIFEEYIEEKNKIKFKIYPNSFMQNNSYVANKLYLDIKKFVYGKCLDLYSGIGTIAIFIADKCEEIKAIELIKDNIKAFEENIKINAKNNIQIINQDVKKYLGSIVRKKNNIDVVISDPPRNGMDNKICDRLKRIKPKRIILISCNPKTLKRDYNLLKENYKLVYRKAYDMFPQTMHMEVMMVIDRKI